MKFSKKIANYLVKQIRKMPEDELEKISIEINELSKLNCWWVEYALKPIIEEIIENEVEIRRA